VAPTGDDAARICDAVSTKGIAILTSLSKQDFVGAISPLLNLPSFTVKKQQILEKHQSSWLYVVS